MNIKRIGIITAGVLALLLTTITLFIWQGAESQKILRITVEGEPVITLEYGQSYEEAGASAQYTAGEYTAQPEVKIEGGVDTTIVGTYLIKYVAVHNGVVGTAYRRVDVLDTKPPEIILVADPEKYTLPNHTYEEEGYTAQDNLDGDITDRVLRQETREKIIYSVSDAAGNKTVVERVIVYNDPVPPELTLNGEHQITVMAGTGFSEPGFTASDNCDGDITGKVAISGGVDIYMPGTYTLTYTVSDSYNNTVSDSRTVTVLPQPAPEVVVPSEKVIYLTFDDGPGPATSDLLDVLKKYNVKATFFVVNTAYIDTIKRVAEEGHAIGIHTTTHQFKEIYSSEDAFLRDLYNMRDIIADITGQTTTLMRFPGGSSNTISSFNPGIMTRLTQKVVDLGFQYFDWNVDSNDAGGAGTAYQVFQNVTRGIGNKQTAIVLQHDIKRFSVNAVERIINWGLSNGYTFLPLSPNSPGAHHGVNN